jgi:hypothetical protein
MDLPVVRCDPRPIVGDQGLGGDPLRRQVCGFFSG